jgi:hypothetical protein
LQIGLSQIFEWYMSDFASSKEKLIEWIKNYVTNEKKEQLSTILESEEEIKIIYLKYNWESNAKGQLPTPEGPKL